MKLFFAICLVISFGLNAAASDTTIVFRQIAYSGATELAKKEHKDLLSYFHFDGCGACLEMEKTVFKNQNVADFFNSNFICFEVNIRKDEGIETNKIYNIQLCPTFLFIDENGNILHKLVGTFSPEDFIAQAKNALNPLKTLLYFKQQYKEGRRDAGFLFDYCYKLRDAYELDSLVINEYLKTQDEKDLQMEQNIKFIYEFAIHSFKITCPYNSPAFDFMINNRDRFYKFFDKDQVDCRIVWIIYDFVEEAIQKQDAIAFDKAIESLKPYDKGQTFTFREVDGRVTGMITSKYLVLSAKVGYYEKAGDKKKFNETLDIYIKKIWNDFEALNDYAWNCYEKYSDTAMLGKALGCVRRSIELDSNYANNDTYAWLLFKLGNYDLSLKTAENTIELARKKNLDFSGTADLVKKIEDKQKK